MDLKDKKCRPSGSLVPPISEEQKDLLLKELGPAWGLADEKRKLVRRFSFKNFKDVMEFAQKVGTIAEEENHHPDLHLGWGFCAVEIWTHRSNDLEENDFILAAKISDTYANFSGPAGA